jgi:hypothetical protein
MPYWMTHEKHGRMPLYDPAEVARAQGNGWTLVNKGETPEYVKKEPEIAAPSGAEDAPVFAPTAWSEAVRGAAMGQGGLGGSRAIQASPDSFEVPVPAKRKPGRPPKAK